MWESSKFYLKDEKASKKLWTSSLSLNLKNLFDILSFFRNSNLKTKQKNLLINVTGCGDGHSVIRIHSQLLRLITFWHAQEAFNSIFEKCTH